MKTIKITGCWDCPFGNGIHAVKCYHPHRPDIDDGGNHCPLEKQGAVIVQLKGSLRDNTLHY